MKLKCLIPFLITGIAGAVPLINGGAVTLSNTATVITINGGGGSQKVAKLRVRVIPGYSCKAYVGGIGHSRTTLSGVWSVLYPNSTGGFSEEFSIDAGSSDNIDLTQIALSGDCAGEMVNVMFYQTGSSSTSLRFFGSGPKTLTASNTSLWTGATTLSAIVRVQVIPGNTGKIHLKGQALGEIAQLYPNSGNPAQSSARSEYFEVTDNGSNLRPDLMYATADVSGEQVLIFLATYF